MKNNYRNNRLLALDIIRSRWLIDNPEQFLPAARSFLNGQTIQDARTDNGVKDGSRIALLENGILRLQGVNEESASPQSSDERSKVLIVPVHGVLDKYDNCFGCSTEEVADVLDEYGMRDDIAAVVLDIDSPGGAANSVNILIQAIRRVQETGRPVVAHVDLCCSAAYWIATATDAIFADNLLSTIGSIGAYSTVFDERENKATGYREISIYAPESDLKNRAYRDALDGKFETMEKELSALVQLFVAAVKEGRPNIKDAEGVFSGATFYPDKAIELGLVDGCAELNQCVEIAFVKSSF